MGEPEREWNLSACGLNCANCDIYMASHGDEDARKSIVDWFRDERNIDLDPEQVRCEGCMGDSERHWSPDCGMMTCAKERELEHCFECGEFPCSRNEEFSADGTPHHRRTIENSKRMRQMGLKAWKQEQMKKGKIVFCP
jgi:hypothetical protein